MSRATRIAAILVPATLMIVCTLLYVLGIATSPSSSAAPVSPTIVNVGQVLNFTVYNWGGDQLTSNQRIYISKQVGCANCDNFIKTGCWAYNETAGPNPRKLRYTVQTSDVSGPWYYKLWNTSCDMPSCWSSCSQGSGSIEVNHAPTFSSVTITPSSPNPSQDLTCTGLYSDSDSDSVTATYLWKGCTTGCPLQAAASCASGTCTATLSHTAIANGNRINCTMNATDQHGFAGLAVVSTTVTVQYSGALTIIPTTAIIEKRSSYPFNATNGGAPFKWNIHNGTPTKTVCSLSSSTTSQVSLTGNAVGNCTLNVTDSSGRSAFSGKIRIQDTDAPGAVSNLAAQDVLGDQGGAIRVSWVLSADDGGGDNDVYNYRIMRSVVSGSGYVNIANKTGGTQLYTDYNVSDATRYYYKVSACDTAGLCTPSSTEALATPNAKPIMKSVTIRPSVLYGTTDVECIAVGYDIDNQLLTMTYSYSVLAFPPGNTTTRTISGPADCIFFGKNTTDQYGVYHANASTECRAVLNHALISKADKVICTMIAWDGYENSTAMKIPQPYIPVNNTPPYATAVTILPASPNESSTLSCNYTYNDFDKDAEDKAGTLFKWYINNEGLNQFVEVPNQNAGTLTGVFDKDDLVKCAVLVKDLDISWMHDSDYATSYASSSAVKIIQNALPQIIAYSSNSNLTNPINVGSNVSFNASWVDYEDPLDVARMFVCDDYTKQENQYNGSNLSVHFGDSAANSPVSVWFYTKDTGKYVYTIAVKPFKFVNNNEWTYAADTVVEQGDRFMNSVLRNFSREAFYDQDGSGTYTYGETVILENITSGTRLSYDPQFDRVIIGTAPPTGTVLSNFTKFGNRFVDRDSSSSFTAADDIYWDRDNNYRVSVGDIRKTVVSESAARTASTPFMYDILVYEVKGIGDKETNSSALLIARSRNNPFTLGVYNYLVPEYNAQPLVGKHLAFKFCMDNNNDDVCDSDDDFANDSVYVHASITGSPDYRVLTSYDGIFYNPDIKFNYMESTAKGCSNIRYCNTSFSSQNTLSCSYTAKDSDNTNNNYLIKVCDQKGGCSIARPGTFYVNHPPTIGKVNISSSLRNFTDNSNLNCSAYNIYDRDSNNVSFEYRWYVKRAGTFQKYDIPNNRILTNGNTLAGDVWKCEAIPFDGYISGAAKNSSGVLITNASFASSILYITSVVDDSNKTHKTNVGDKVTFRVSWGSSTMGQVRMFVCNSSSILDNGCWDFTFNSTQLSSANPIIGTYAPKDTDVERNYWVRICSNAGNCSNNYPSGNSKLNFTVNHLPTINVVNISSSKGNYTDDANLNCSVHGISDSDSDPVSFVYKWYVMRPGGSFSSLITGFNFSSDILSNSNTWLYDIWKCEATPKDGYGYGQAKNSSPVLIINTSASKLGLRILSVADDSNSSNPTNLGSKVTFTVSWAGSSYPVKMYICNSSTIYSSGCAGYTFVYGWTYAYQDPIIDSYYVGERDSEDNYWIRICNNQGNCSAVYPSSGEINFTTNHRPNASHVKVIAYHPPGSNVLVCNYSFSDPDSNKESGSDYLWYVDYGYGYIMQFWNSKNITDGLKDGYKYKCSVLPKDEHGLSSLSYVDSSNSITVTPTPQKPVLWGFPEAVRSNKISIVGHINAIGLNVTAIARQGVLNPKVNSVITTWNSTFIGSAKIVDNIPEGKRYIIVSASDSNLFTTSRYVEFVNYFFGLNDTLYRDYFTRYGITGKTNLFDGTYRIDLAENLSYSLEPYDYEGDEYYSVANVYNSSKPTGWFNISLNLFNDSNDVAVFGVTDFGQGEPEGTSVFVDLYPPTIDTRAVPSVSSLANLTLRFNVSDNYVITGPVNDLLLKITNKTANPKFKPVNFSTEWSYYYNAEPNISCDMINGSFAACTLNLWLFNGTYNLTFSTNDTAGYRVVVSKLLSVNTSAIVKTTVTDGYLDVDGKHIPSDFATTANLTANWTAMTGVDYYEYRLDQYNGSIFDKTVVDWTRMGLNLSTNVSRGVTNGYVYHFVVRAKATSGGYTPEAVSDGILYLDSTSPTCLNCVYTTGDFTNSNDTLHYYWNFTQHQSAIVEYRYAIGTKCYPYVGYDNIVAPKSTDKNSITEYNLKLRDGVSYCVSVKARNVNNIWSAWKSANITADLSKPFNGSINYTSGYITGNTTIVRFYQGKDNVSGISRVQLQMASLPLVDNDCAGIFDYNDYVNFSSQVLGQTFKTVRLQPGRCYKFQIKVTDYAGNFEIYPRGIAKIVKVDGTPPESFAVTLNNHEFYTQDNNLHATWTQSSDPESGISHYMYALFSYGNQITSYRNTTSRTASITAALLHQQSYYLKVIAFNRAGLSRPVNSNNILFLDFTPPSPVIITRVDNDTNASNRYLDLDSDNFTTVYAVGELGISCIISPYDIDYTDNYGLPYVTHCNLTGSGPNVTCPVLISRDGNYTYYVACRDTNGNAQDMSQNTEVNWIVDRYGPNITIQKPAPNQTVGGKIQLDTEIRDPMGVDKASFRVVNFAGSGRLNGTLLPPFWNTTWNTLGKNYSGLHFFIVTANDTLGRRSNKTVNFTINNGLPVLDITHSQYTRENLSLVIQAQLFVNVSFNITNTTNTLFVYKKNSSTLMRNYIIWSNLINTTNVNRWREGNYSISVWAINNKKNTTKKKSLFIIDRRAPLYSKISNTSKKVFHRNNTIIFNVSWSDNTKMATIMFSYNASGNWTNVSYTSATSNQYRLTIPAFTIKNSQSVGWYSFARDMAGNTNSTYVQTFTIENYAPKSLVVYNQTVNATDTVNIAVNAFDPDNDNLTYSINDSRFTLSANIFGWNTNINDFGNYVANVSASDGRVTISQKVWIAVLHVDDTDGDGIPDYKEADSDNDGLPNTIDFLNGYSYSVKTNIANFNCSVGGSFNLRQQFNSTLNINCTNKTRPIITFPYAFGSAIPLNMIRINITKQPAGSNAGWLIVRGLVLLDSTTKTVYLDHLNNSIGSVCVKDTSYATTISQISSSCNNNDEHMVLCDGSLYYSNFTCISLGSYFRVTGLRNSIVREQTGCTDRDGDGYGIGGLCLGSDYDDNNANIHEPPQILSGGSSSGGGGGGGISGLIKKINQTKASAESWVCTEWSECSLVGLQTRQCVDRNHCGTYNFIPQQTRKCTPTLQPTGQPNPSCYDGIQNDGETGVDCGGPCQACPTCVDGIQNGGETGVDCGGPCPSCTPIVTQQPPSVPWSTIVLAVVTVILLLSVVLLYSKLKPKRPTIPPTVDLPLRQQRLLEAQKYVLHKLHTGAPRTEIEEALTSKGWSTDIINKMIKLENYIRLGHSKGHSYDVIRQSLRRVGWLPEVIDEIINYCEQTRKF